MKKNAFLAIALTATFLFTSCENQKCDCEEDQQTPVLESPDNIIPLVAADSLYINYGNSRVSLIELTENITEEGDSIPKEDARYKRATRVVTMPYKKFKEYIAYIEQQADYAGIEIAEMRFYFGKYKNTFKEKDKRGKATLFLNPATEFTLADGTKDTVSYAIVTGTDGKKRAVMVGSILKPKEGDVGAIEGETTDSQSGDHTTMRPPPPLSDGDF